MSVRTDVQLEWGHKVLNPQGQAIRLPAKAIVQLRRLGLFEKRRGVPQTSPFIYTLLDLEYDPLTMGLREVIGQDISGRRPASADVLRANANGI